MAADHTIPVRSAVIGRLKLEPRVAAILGGRIYTEEPPPEPVRPWAKWDSPIVGPFDASGLSGSSMRVTLSIFADGPGEDLARKLARLFVAVLDENLLPLIIEADELGTGEILAEPSLLELYYRQTQVVRDTDVIGAYHAIVEFDALTAAPD